MDLAELAEIKAIAFEPDPVVFQFKGHYQPERIQEMIRGLQDAYPRRQVIGLAHDIELVSDGKRSKGADA